MMKRERIKNWIVRAALNQDRKQIANLIHFEPHIHRHLDWRQPLDFIEDNAFIVIEENSRIIAALLCPRIQPQVSWIRLFAVASGYSLEETWNDLWIRLLTDLPSKHPVVSMPLQDWYKRLLEDYSFEHKHDVIMLSRYGTNLPKSNPMDKFNIRRMNQDDISEVCSVDNTAFKPIWQHSEDDIRNAYQQSVIATVAEGSDGIIGYLISTKGPMGGHIARLAVLPDSQSKGIGYCLVRDTLERFTTRGVFQITVNTQTDNISSLALYEKMGFVKTGESYPVYVFLHPE